MNSGSKFRITLGGRIFLSYLIIIAVGVLVLAGVVQIQMPSAIQRHTERMALHLLTDPGLVEDLRLNFTAAINEITFTAAVAALVVAVVMSIYTARRIIMPIRTMSQASKRIAAGHFEQRVDVFGEDELAELAVSFNQMAAQLEQTEQRRMALIGDVAHELRTPLTNIRSIMEGLTDGVLPAELETYQNVQREVMRLQRLVQDLQELSRAEAGQLPLKPEAVAPAELVQATVERLRVQFEEKDVRLDVQVDPGLPLVRADPARITQVLLNLLGNALHYTPAGGKVSVRAQVEGPQMVFWVRDTGIGVPPEHLPHLFERFYRVDKSRSRAGGGSGIGLTIARHIVEIHGGAIWAESEGAGKGATFCFSLPLA